MSSSCIQLLDNLTHFKFRLFILIFLPLLGYLTFPIGVHPKLIHRFPTIFHIFFKHLYKIKLNFFIFCKTIDVKRKLIYRKKYLFQKCQIISYLLTYRPGVTKCLMRHWSILNIKNYQIKPFQKFRISMSINIMRTLYLNLVYWASFPPKQFNLRNWKSLHFFP